MQEENLFVTGCDEEQWLVIVGVVSDRVDFRLHAELPVLCYFTLSLALFVRDIYKIKTVGCNLERDLPSTPAF